MMTPATLKAAIAEAERFLRVAKAVPLVENRPTFPEEGGVVYADRRVEPSETFNPSRHSAAAKRSSMDLTRVLADLRRP